MAAKTVWIRRDEKTGLQYLDHSEFDWFNKRKNRTASAEPQHDLNVILDRLYVCISVVVDNQIKIAKRIDEIENCPVRQAFTKEGNNEDKTA